MRLIKSLLLSLGLIFALSGQAADIAEGRDYVVINPPLANDNPGKVEVTEFFWYGCIHCFHFESVLQPWAKNAPKDVALRVIPAPLNPQWAPGAKLYYTLDALGLESRLRAEIFDAIHNSRKLSPIDERSFADFVAARGGDGAKFRELYNSFTIQTKVQRAGQITNAAKIDGTPAVVVGGKYRVVEPGALSASQFNTVVSALIAKAKAEGLNK